MKNNKRKLPEDLFVEINTWDFSKEFLLELLPEKYYKYCTINDYLKDSLQNNQLFYNMPANFNDPFDCKAVLNFGNTKKECIQNFKKYNAGLNIDFTPINMDLFTAIADNPKNFSLLISDRLAKSLENSIGVTCFSENYNSTLMWSHYANSHKGVVLEFKKDIENGILIKKLLPVNYFEEYPEIMVGDYDENQMLSIYFQMLCAKSHEWGYENEWRATQDEGNKLYKFNKCELSGVIFGLKTEKNEKREIYDLIQNTGYRDILFKEAKFSFNSFNVEYEEYKK